MNETVATVEDNLIEVELSTMYLKGGFKELRKLRGLSQKDISLKTGLSIKTISAIENPFNHSNNPTLRSLLAYMSVLDAELKVGKKTI